MTDLSERIRAWREAADLTQTAVADLLKVKQQTVSGWERGKNPPGVRHWPLLDKAFGLPPGTVGRAVQSQPQPRGIPDDPHFEVVLGDWEEISEKDRRFMAETIRHLRRRERD